MRSILLLVAAILLIPAVATAQPVPATSLKALFDAAQRLGNDTELRGDIADRLGFGTDALPIKDLVVTANGVQHAVNAFVVGDKAYLLFDSHLYVPEIFIFVTTIDGTFAAGIHGRQYQPVTDTANISEKDAGPVIAAEESFWSQWLADGAKLPPK
jgi:hypothetical protein